MKPASRLAEFWEDWAFLLRRDGARTALPMIGLDIARLPYRHLRFQVIGRSLLDPLPDLCPKTSLEICPFDRSHLEMVQKINRPSEARLCARRLDNGHRGLVALSQGRLAGYAWGCDEIHPQIEPVHIDLEPGDVLCNDAFTNPAFRGQGVQTALALARCRLFRALGFLRAICYIEIRNGPSLAVWQRKLGGVVVGSVDFLRIGPWYWVRCEQANAE